MNKKGQTEDIFADLIPSLIIIAVGIFLFSKISEIHEAEIDKQSEGITSILEKDVFSLSTYLNSPVIIENVRLTRADIINRMIEEKQKGKIINDYEQRLKQEDLDLGLLLKDYCFAIKIESEGDTVYTNPTPLIPNPLKCLSRTEKMEILLTNNKAAEVTLGL